MNTQNTQNRQTTTRVSPSAILFATLIGIGFWITLAVLGGAFAVTYAPATAALLMEDFPVLLVILAVSMLSLAFLVAGYIASKVSHQRFLFDSVIHSLSTWSLMAILLLILLSSTVLTSSIARSVHELKATQLSNRGKYF